MPSSRPSLRRFQCRLITLPTVSPRAPSLHPLARSLARPPSLPPSLPSSLLLFALLLSRARSAHLPLLPSALHQSLLSTYIPAISPINSLYAKADLLFLSSPTKADYYMSADPTVSINTPRHHMSVKPKHHPIHQHPPTPYVRETESHHPGFRDAIPAERGLVTNGPADAEDFCARRLASSSSSSSSRRGKGGGDDKHGGSFWWARSQEECPVTGSCRSRSPSSHVLPTPSPPLPSLPSLATLQPTAL